MCASPLLTESQSSHADCRGRSKASKESSPLCTSTPTRTEPARASQNQLGPSATQAPAPPAACPKAAAAAPPKSLEDRELKAATSSFESSGGTTQETLSHECSGDKTKTQVVDGTVSDVEVHTGPSTPSALKDQDPSPTLSKGP